MEIPETQFISSSSSSVNQPVYITKKTQEDEPVFSPTTPTDVSSMPPVTFHITHRSYLERVRDGAVSEVYRHSFEVAKFEKQHLLSVEDAPQKLLEARPRRLSHVLPQLTGEYKNIGYTNLIINGPHREIGVEVYAPTLDSSGKPLRMQIPKGEFEELLGTDQLRTMHTHSLDSFQQLGKFPLIIFSHGYDTDPVQYRPLLEELASHGYKVLSLNHPSSSAHAPFSDPLAPRDRDEAGVRVRELWLNDLDRLALIQADNIQFIVNYVRQQGEIEPIVLAGHSLGGAASMIAAKRDPEIGACINLDYVRQQGGIESLLGEKRPAALSTPLLQILSDHSQYKELIAKDLEQLQGLQDTFENVQTGLIPGIGHMDFSAKPFLTWLLGEKTLDGALKAHVVASRAIVQFLNDWLPNVNQ